MKKPNSQPPTLVGLGASGSPIGFGEGLGQTARSHPHLKRRDRLFFSQ
ncbi:MULTISPECIES: hypothetical protein [Cyanophyceae]|nr:hypothetical protein [Trichocoleus sp. FACHB-69]MBD1934284.1 hypothetical protein [Trichocoleus sp. FACHB-69]